MYSSTHSGRRVDVLNGQRVLFLHIWQRAQLAHQLPHAFARDHHLFTQAGLQWIRPSVNTALLKSPRRSDGAWCWRNEGRESWTPQEQSSRSLRARREQSLKQRSHHRPLLLQTHRYAQNLPQLCKSGFLCCTRSKIFYKCSRLSLTVFVKLKNSPLDSVFLSTLMFLTFSF